MITKRINGMALVQYTGHHHPFERPLSSQGDRNRSPYMLAAAFF